MSFGMEGLEREWKRWIWAEGARRSVFPSSPRLLSLSLFVLLADSSILTGYCSWVDTSQDDVDLVHPRHVRLI